MIILLYGKDTYRSSQKLKEIIKKYRESGKTGIDFAIFNLPDMDKIKSKIQSISMFDEKKLIVLKDIFENDDFLKEFFKYASKHKLKEKNNVIVVIYEKDDIKLKPEIKNQVNMYQQFNPLSEFSLVRWIINEVRKRNGAISKFSAQKLAYILGNDLWRVSNEIDKLISYKNGEVITEKDIDSLISRKIEADIFKTIDAIAGRDKKTAVRLIHNHLFRGEKEVYLLSMLTFQVRNLIKIKDLQEKGVPYYNLHKRTNLHPYVVKKLTGYSNKFDLNELRYIYKKILETEIEIKTGKINPRVALDLLVNTII